jgi:hypothetical protein
MSQSAIQLHHKDCEVCSVSNIQSDCNKHTCLQSASAVVFSVILLCCELCQAVSSCASAQTAHRPTAALPSRFWHHWIHSLPILYSVTGTEIAVGLEVESCFETDNGARIGLWNVCVLESNDAAVGLRKFHRTLCRVTTVWIERVVWGKITIR